MSPAYADGYGRWHVLVPEGPRAREEAIAVMAEAMLANEHFYSRRAAVDYLKPSITETPVEGWDGSPAFGGVEADLTKMAHFVEYPT